MNSVWYWTWWIQVDIVNDKIKMFTARQDKEQKVVYLAPCKPDVCWCVAAQKQRQSNELASLVPSSLGKSTEPSSPVLNEQHREESTTASVSFNTNFNTNNKSGDMSAYQI